MNAHATQRAYAFTKHLCARLFLKKKIAQRKKRQRSIFSANYCCYYFFRVKIRRENKLSIFLRASCRKGLRCRFGICVRTRHNEAYFCRSDLFVRFFYAFSLQYTGEKGLPFLFFREKLYRHSFTLEEKRSDQHAPREGCARKSKAFISC